ncbi:GNAT family N-acetyltransferase [Pseudomonas sp. BJa3]|uniref:GNAT family N-acetyltransferase n=1 Tax=Pseudomonas sp. BJa3 TaxID=2986525 RepID=UPI002265B184|nr:GNAT family N-acetyltransferase [Pseudomonas sp. BJa3]MCX5508231.1 GNAT family N-acetyltransferase [Pseudomonas sp. BJa3]
MDFITVDFDKSIDRSAFDCKIHPALNAYITQQAGQDQKRNVSRTFMYIEKSTLLGFYTLANASVALDSLSENQQKKMPRYPIPAILLSRLAVDRTAQKQGLGKRLMADFFRRVCVVARHSGVAFIVVDAKDMDAASYYHSKLGFVPSSNNPFRLVLPTATLLNTV